jgi:hypothetical protein
MMTARSASRAPRSKLGRHSEPTSTEHREIEELDRLIMKLPTFRPLAKFLRSQGIDPKSQESQRLSTIMIVQLCVGQIFLIYLIGSNQSDCRWCRRLSRNTPPQPTKGGKSTANLN